MKLVIRADKAQQEEWLQKPVPADVVMHWHTEGMDIPTADAFFELLYEKDGRNAFDNITDRPVFINDVAGSGNYAGTMVRLNAWPGFINRDILEIAGSESAVAGAIPVLDALGWKYLVTPDKPGMIAARIIAKIINEAYFGLGENISSKEEIDTAMKLGTNYPMGPFEWSEKIGLTNIYELLQALDPAGESIAPALRLAVKKEPV